MNQLESACLEIQESSQTTDKVGSDDIGSVHVKVDVQSGSVDAEFDVKVGSVDVEVDIEAGPVDVEVGQLRKTQVRDFRSRKLERLKDLDLFCLDNSIRESTVGQLRSHTLENKIAIFQEVKKCGIKDVLVASFAHMTRVVSYPAPPTHLGRERERVRGIVHIRLVPV